MIPPAQIVILHGEPYLTLELAAECYSLEITFVREVYDRGLLGPGEATGEGGAIAIPAPLLDRLAAIVRMTHHQGIDLDLVALLLDDLERP